MKRSFVAALAVLVGLGAQDAHADPAARAAAPIEEGNYTTRWGAAELKLLNNRANAALTFGASAVFFGTLRETERTWAGAWIHPDAEASGARRCARTFGEPGDASHRWPDSVTVRPRSHYWGRFEGRFSADGRSIRLSWTSCDTPVAFTPESSNLFWANKAAVAITAAAPRTVNIPTLPRDGPCLAISATAVASIDPCRLEPFKPLRVTMLRDLPKGATRVTFTPLVDDLLAVSRAADQHGPRPLHPTARPTFQVIRGNKLWVRGDRMDVIPPGAVCGHDLWAVSLTDGTGASHGDLGIVSPTCGPGNAVPRLPRAEPRGVERATLATDAGAPAAK